MFPIDIMGSTKCLTLSLHELTIKYKNTKYKYKASNNKISKDTVTHYAYDVDI